MNSLLKYQLKNINFNGSLNKLQTIALLDAVDKVYDRADENFQTWVDMLSISSKGYKSLKNDSLQEFINKEKKYQRLLLNLQPYYFFYTKNHEGRFILVSDSVSDMLGFTEQEFIVRYSEYFMYGLRTNIETRVLISEYGYNIPYQISLEDRDGALCHIEITEFPVFNEKNELIEIEGIARDITEQTKTNSKISNMLYNDSLTGISNKLHLEVLMEKLILDNYRKKNSFAVLFLDLDYFKHINDTLGHDIGDILLQQISQSISKYLKFNDIFARIGGDEFVIVFKNLENSELVLKIQDLMTLVRQPWIVNSYELHISVSIGVSRYPEDGKSTVDLMKNADIAMYKSKSIGRDNFVFFEEQFNEIIHTDMKFIQNMSDALSKKEFLFHYQPKVLLSTNEVIAAEALIRWNHPEMGLVYPDKFILLAENTGFILKLGKWIIEEACESIVEFNEMNPSKKLNLAINISVRQFQHEDMYVILKEAIERNGIDGSQLSIELTESIMMENNNDMVKKLLEIKSLNVGISLDDFGTGYSTLSYLDKLSIDELKIDKAFIDAIPENGKSNILLDTIISMGKTLNMTVVAEGVEHEYQRQYLYDKGCDIYQGYLFSKPVSKEEYSKYLLA